MKAFPQEEKVEVRTCLFSASEMRWRGPSKAPLEIQGEARTRADLPLYFYRPASGCRKQDTRWSFTSPVACMWA